MTEANIISLAGFDIWFGEHSYGWGIQTLVKYRLFSCLLELINFNFEISFEKKKPRWLSILASRNCFRISFLFWSILDIYDNLVRISHFKTRLYTNTFYTITTRFLSRFHHSITPSLHHSITPSLHHYSRKVGYTSLLDPYRLFNITWRIPLWLLEPCPLYSYFHKVVLITKFTTSKVVMAQIIQLDRL